MDVMTREEIDSFLDEQTVGRMGCHDAGVTYVVPLIYARDGDALYVLTTQGEKIRIARKNPAVCFEVDEYEAATGSWRSVIVQGRYEDATKVAPPRPLEQKEFADTPAVSPEEVQAMIEAGEPVQILDTRPRHFTARAEDIMEGAVWRDPDRLEDWIGELKPDVPVVTFCVYGFHVGCQMAIALRKAGFDARYMSAGHSGWKAIGGKVRRFDEGTRP